MIFEGFHFIVIFIFNNVTINTAKRLSNYRVKIIFYTVIRSKLT
jgi:hypothetical protein